MASKVGSNGKRTCNPIPMEDVQGDNRWMDMVRNLSILELFEYDSSFDVA